MKQTDIINYHINNPPFEVTDIAKYTSLLEYVLKFTVHEMSENDPIIEELVFNSNDVQDPEDVPTEAVDYILIDTVLLDENFMEFIILHETEIGVSTLLSDINIYSRMYGYGSVSASMSPMQAAFNSSSVTGWLAYNDYFHIIQEWFETKVAKIYIQGTKIKLRPDTSYTTLYNRYRKVHEISNSVLGKFRQLLGINLMLTIYNSDTFSSEAGIRSVSLSGLSVSFNVASADSKIVSLNKEKRDILASIGLNFGTQGMVGLI